MEIGEIIIVSVLVFLYICCFIFIFLSIKENNKRSKKLDEIEDKKIIFRKGCSLTNPCEYCIRIKEIREDHIKHLEEKDKK